MNIAIKLVIGSIFFFGIWFLIPIIFSLPEYLFPSPLSTFEAMIQSWLILLTHSAITVEEVLIGFVIANFLSVFLAIVIAFIPRVEGIAISSAVILKTLPIIAIAPLLVLWFGSGIWSKVAAVAVVCFFPSLVNVLRGIKSLDTATYDLLNLYSPTKWQTVRYFLLPGIKPYLFAALKVSSSLAVIGALVGEFVSANSGLGFLIISSYYSLNIPLVFACLFMTSFVGLSLYGIIHLLEKRSVTDNSVLEHQ